MDHFVAATVTENGLDFTGLVADDTPRVGGAIGGQTATKLDSVGAAHGHRVAALKIALDGDDTGGQQALARGQRLDRAGIDVQRPDRLQGSGDPAFARRASLRAA